MTDYRSYLESVIRRGDFVLAEMEDKLTRLWIEGRITETDRDELTQLAAEYAEDRYQIDVVAKLAELERRIYDLEWPTEQYPVWQKGQVSERGVVYRADVTGDGELDLVRYDGGRASTSLSIGKIEGWHLLSRELEVVATITRDADGGYVITPVNPEPVDEGEPTGDE